MDSGKRPTHSFSLEPQVINEGSTLTTIVSTTNVDTNTTLYYSLSGGGITSDDFSGQSLLGSGSVDSNGEFSFSYTVANDFTTESREKIIIKLFTDRNRTHQVAGKNVWINDTSQEQKPSPTFELTKNKSTVNEGQTITFSVKTKNLTNRQYFIGVGWGLSGGGITSDDFVLEPSQNGTYLEVIPKGLTHLQRSNSFSWTNDKGGIERVIRTKLEPANSYEILPGYGYERSGYLNGDIRTADTQRETAYDISLLTKIDHTTEGDETLLFTLFSGSRNSALIPMATATVTIKDTSKTIPYYSVSSSPSTIDEGQSFTTTLKATNVPSGTNLYWRLTDIDASDLRSGSLTGSQTVNNYGQITLAHKIANDKKTEGTETAGITFYSDPYLTDEVGSTSYVTINDTSKTIPTYSGSSSFPTTIDEGQSFTTSFQAHNVPSGTKLYWRITGIDASDLSYGSLTGSQTVNNYGEVNFTTYIANDKELEGTETARITFYSDAYLTDEVGSTSSVRIYEDSFNTNIGSGNTINSGNTNIGSENTTVINKPTYNIRNTKIINKISNVFKNDYITYQNKSTDYKFYNLGEDRYAIKTDSGYDEITGVTNLQFSDKTLNLENDIADTFDQVTGLNTDSGEMFRLYNAAFARFPDADGLNYWIDQFSSGRNSRRVVAQSFLGSAEFAERYGTNVTNEKYVETLYTNVLGRNSDLEGYNYWVGNLNSGLETRYELLLGFSESVENKALFTDMTGWG